MYFNKLENSYAPSFVYCSIQNSSSSRALQLTTNSKRINKISIRRPQPDSWRRENVKAEKCFFGSTLLCIGKFFQIRFNYSPIIFLALQRVMYSMRKRVSRIFLEEILQIQRRWICRTTLAFRNIVRPPFLTIFY